MEISFKTKNNTEEIIEKLNMELQTCIEDNKTVALHIRTKGTEMIVRYELVPDEAHVSSDTFYVAGGLFQIKIEHKIDEIVECNDFGHNYYVTIDVTELYLDFDIL